MAEYARSKARRQEQARLIRTARDTRYAEEFEKLLRRYDLELLVRAVAGLLVETPSPKLRGMPKAAALHVIVRDFNDQFGPERLPRRDPCSGSNGSGRLACDAQTRMVPVRARPTVARGDQQEHFRGMAARIP